MSTQVYGRFLEYVRNEPGAAGRYYEAAMKAGTSESLLALTTAEGGAARLSAAGQIDEKVSVYTGPLTALWQSPAFT